METSPYTNAVIEWFGPSASREWIDSTPHRDKVRRILTAAADLAPSMADALAAIADEYEQLDKQDGALYTTTAYLETNAADAERAARTMRDRRREDQSQSAAEKIHVTRAHAYRDAARVLDIARGL